MGKAIVPILIGAAIIGAAIVTGGISLAPSLGAVGAGGAEVAGGAFLAGTLGAGLATTALGGLALALGASAVLSGVMEAVAKTPKTSLTQLDRLNASMVPTAPRKMAFGRTAMNTDIRYVEPSGKNQEYIDYIICVAAHRVTSIEELWLEDKQAWNSTDGVRPGYAGFLTVNTVLEGSASNYITINDGSKWGANQRLTGCAYIHLRVKRSGTNSPFASGLASRMTIIGRGMPLYDPRYDSTVAGGSGSMRADDQSTWSYYTPSGAELGENLALQTLAYLHGWKINGKLSVGRGLPSNRLNLAQFAVSASLCDETVTTSTGSQLRYHGAGVVSEGDGPSDVLQTFCTACNGRMREEAGQLSLVIMHNDLALAATDPGLTDDDVTGAFVWNPDPSLEQTYNVVRGRYTNPDTSSLYQLVDYPEVSLPSVDGIDRILTLDLPWVEDAARAQRIAKQVLERKQYQRSFSAPFGPRAAAYTVGQLVPLTFTALSFNRRLFRVSEAPTPFKGQRNFVLTEENAALYAWDADDRAPVTAADPITYDPSNNPIQIAAYGAQQSAADAATAAGLSIAINGPGVVSCDSSGAPKPGQLPLTANIFLYHYDTDIHTEATYSADSQSGGTFAVDANGVVTLSAITDDTASVVITAMWQGYTLKQPYSVSKVRDGANGAGGSSQTFDVGGEGTWGPTSPIPLAAGQSLSADGSINAMTASASAKVTMALQVSSDGSNWSVIATDQVNVSPGEPAGPSPSGSYTNGSGSQQVVKVRAVVTRTGQQPDYDSGYCQVSTN